MSIVFADRDKSAARQSVNKILLYVLPAVVLFAMIPLASNRPFFWMLNGLLIGVVGIAYGFYLGSRAIRPRIGITPLGVPALLYASVVTWVAVQAFGGLLGSAFPSLDAGFSATPGASIASLIRYITYGVLFVLALQAFARPDRAIVGLRLLFGIVVLQAVIAIVSLVQLGDTLLLSPKWAYEGVATGTFVSRNHVSTFFAFGLVIAMALLVTEIAAIREVAGRRLMPSITAFVAGWPALLIVGSAIILVALAATGSRMGLFVAFLGPLAVLVMMLPLSRSSLFALLLGVVTAAFVALWSVTGSALFERVGNLERDADVRLQLYDQVLDLIALRPWSGHGAGSFEVAFNAVRHPPVNSDLRWGEAHNTYLELAAEIGVPATAILMVALLLVIVRCLVAIPSAGRSRTAPVIAVGAALVAGTHSLVDFSLQIQANALLFTCLLGAGVAQALQTISSRRSVAGIVNE